MASAHDLLANSGIPTSIHFWYWPVLTLIAGTVVVWVMKRADAKQQDDRPDDDPKVSLDA